VAAPVVAALATAVVAAAVAVVVSTFEKLEFAVMAA